MVSVKSSKWNLGKPGVWDVYQELTNNASKEIKDVVFNDELGIDEVMKKVETIEKDVKFAAFGKTRINQNKANKKVAKVDKTDEEWIKRQSKKMEDEIL